MNQIGYIFYRGIDSILSRLPFSWLHSLSDFVTFVLFSVIGYRRKVVEGQLKKCFPEWNDAKIKHIAKESYRNLSDVLLESFKTASLPADKMAERYKIRNPEVVEKLVANGKDLIGIGSHCNNWEWASVAVPRKLSPILVTLYKPLVNPLIDQHVKDVREKAGTQMVSIRETRTIFEQKSEKPRIFMFVADQSPSNMREAIWLDFLGQDTACLHGPEKYQEQTELDVVYFHVYRVKRGFYEVAITQIFPSKDNPLTHQFMALLEKDVIDDPEGWLWTHKRWKRRREEAQEQMEKLKNRGQ